MIYGSISLALLCLYANNSFAALENITKSEKLNLPASEVITTSEKPTFPALEAIGTAEEPIIPALEVITALEKQTLDTIEQQYNLDTLLITVNDRFSQLNKKAYDIESLKKSIISEQQRYDDLIAELPNVIRAKTTVAETYKQIEASIYSVDKLTQEVEDDINHLQTEKAEILAEYENINKNAPIKLNNYLNSKQK